MHRDEHIIRLYTKNHLSGNSIAVLLDCSNTTVYRVLQRNGIAPRLRPGTHRHRQSSVPGNEDTIIELYRQGLSLAKIGERFGVTHVTVLRVLRDHGVPRRLRGGWRRKKVFTEAELEQIRMLRLAGTPNTQIADELQTSHARISTAVAQLGLPKRIDRRRMERVDAGQGYIAVKLQSDDPLFALARKSDGRVLEHRLVMARHLGRLLHAGETVHHKNGIRDDNRLDNLQLRQGQHGNGIRLRCALCGSHDLEPCDL